MNLVDLYYKKTVPYKHGHHVLQFRISQELFSSLDIDNGTQRLLRTLLFENISSYSKVLDLGCGYGPIGITMKKVCPSAEVHLVDIDALALEFARENTQLNATKDTSVYASLGYDQVIDTDFDIIVSNIPAKVGEKAIIHILKDARHYLVKNGKVIVVVIDAIADFVRQQLEEDKNITTTYYHSWPGHHVYHYQFVADHQNSSSQQSAFEQGVFFRESQLFSNSIGKYSFDVSYNLAEFDQLSYETQLLARVLNGITDSVESAFCFHVGQGHIPFFITKHFGLDTIELSDRDLLALKTSQHNLAKYRVSVNIAHSVLPQSEKKNDLIVGCVPEKQGPEVYTAFLTAINKSLWQGGKAAIVSSSTTMNRIEDLVKKKFKLLNREKENGISAFILQK
ncbi:MAG: methyltransferase [Candidatus Pacebacteria bacterium]|nr:methyltransferase [Candidatus Paceibacterota bacterium]